jgi:hypothetical protein
MMMSAMTAATGAGTPTNTVFGPTGNIKQRKFGINDSVYISCHIDHDIKRSSLMYPHVHWATGGTSTNIVKWQFSYMIAAGHNQANFPTETVITLEQAAAGSAWRHMITEDTVGVAAPEIDSLVLLELKRITNGGTENTDDVFGLFVDFHYQVDGYATPSKAPDFYKAI